MPKLRKHPRQGGTMMSKILEVELATLEKRRKHLEQEHAGKFVLIHANDVVGTYDDFEKAADEGLRQFGREPFLIRQIGQEALSLPVAVVYGLTVASP